MTIKEQVTKILNRTDCTFMKDKEYYLSYLQAVDQIDNLYRKEFEKKRKHEHCFCKLELGQRRCCQCAETELNIVLC